jgi:hypothetical protein
VLKGLFFDSWPGKKFFSVSVQTDQATQPSVQWVLGVEFSEYAADCSSLFCVQVKNHGGVPLLPHVILWFGA